MNTNRITPEIIKHLESGEIFVFGSNTAGMHAGGAARVAQQWGAVWGKPEGLQGNTYALPTVGHTGFAKWTQIGKPLPLAQVKKHVDIFIRCAERNPHLFFYVTPVGCGIAGFKVKDIAPMFIETVSLPNVALPASFWLELGMEPPL